MALESGPTSGKKVIEVQGISKAFGDRVILAPFDLRIQRGDRIAFVGPNGAGKTTLIKMLTGEVAPDEGTVTLGTNLEIAVFDQARAALNPNQTLWESLTGDPDMSVSGRADQVMVRGVPKHVVAYLKDFLFDERQARGPASALSGGERARLLLARIMARESNLLVLDEPTNDLDIETLDLLQELIADFDGTVLLVSHDRDFIDRTVTATIAMEGDGRALIYAGGWSDYRAQRGDGPARPEARRVAAKAAPVAQRRAGRATAKLTFAQQNRLDSLPPEIDRLNAEIAKLEAFLSGPEVFAREPVKFRKASAGLAERRERLTAAEEEWLTLEGMREASS
jgi:ATP-binding cassette subfamily F protein uup